MAKVFDRLLLFIYSVAVAAAAAMCLAFTFHWIGIKDTFDFIDDVYDVEELRYSVLGAAAVLFLISLRFLVLSVKVEGGTPPSINQRTDYGDIRISMETVENLALKAASKVKAVKDVRAKVKINPSGLEIIIRTFVDGETPIPSLTEDVQRSVKEHVEEITGIPVAYVSVFVANLTASSSHTFRSRVE